MKSFISRKMFLFSLLARLHFRILIFFCDSRLERIGLLWRNLIAFFRSVRKLIDHFKKVLKFSTVILRSNKLSWILNWMTGFSTVLDNCMYNFRLVHFSPADTPWAHDLLNVDLMLFRRRATMVCPVVLMIRYFCYNTEAIRYVIAIYVSMIDNYLNYLWRPATEQN